MEQPRPQDPPEPGQPGGARGWNGFGAHNWPGADWRPYGDHSPFNRPVGAAPVHPQSAAYVQRVLSWGKPGNLVAGVSGTTKDYAHPTYYAQPDDPIFTLRATGTKNYLEGMKIPIPDEARAAGGSDGHMTVVTPDGWEYDFWQVRDKPRGGGTLSFSIGGRTRIDGDGLDGKGTAANFGNLAGVIRHPELAAGRIDHALFIVLKCTSGTTGFGYETKPAPSSSQGAYVWPALHGGARCDDSAPPMGARFHLAMSEAQIETLPVPRWKKTILTALATYGGYVGDTGGSGFALQFESSSTYTSFGTADPLVSLAKDAGLRSGSGDWAGTYVFDMASGVDWARYLRVVTPPQPVAAGAVKGSRASGKRGQATRRGAK